MSQVGVEAVAVITGSFLSGAMMSVFLLTIPSVLETTTDPGQLLHHWARVFLNGHVKGPIICITTTFLYGLAAFTKYSAGEPWRVFAAAGIVTISMVPFTLVVIDPVNTALFRMESEAKKGTVAPWAVVEPLVQKWNRLNLTRAFCPLAGAVLGLLGTLKLVSF
ncbi:hypothetical protein ARAM_004339 [Aspergillus rambellii]|uniref:Uncharacterized protein n=1 Tax=Aspergillus rambellii TaxID=308745 RepID=A0A0F8VFF7_9EURO|nr:hypothetical protein ARAM_004339 [Aspergillus rambellii]